MICLVDVFALASINLEHKIDRWEAQQALHSPNTPAATPQPHSRHTSATCCLGEQFSRIVRRTFERLPHHDFLRHDNGDDEARGRAGERGDVELRSDGAVVECGDLHAGFDGKGGDGGWVAAGEDDLCRDGRLAGSLESRAGKEGWEGDCGWGQGDARWRGEYAWPFGDGWG